jgi:hypothetical protein
MQAHLLQLKGAFLQIGVQFQGRQDSPSGMVLKGQGSAKQRHETIAQELINRAPIPVHRAQGKLKKTVQEGMHALRTQALSQGRGTDQITKQHGDLFALAF